PLLLRFGSLAFCLSIGGRLCLALCLLFEPLLLSFLSLAFRFSLGRGFGLVRAGRIRLLRRRPPRHPHRHAHLIESDPAREQQSHRAPRHHAPPARHHQPRCRVRQKWPLFPHRPRTFRPALFLLSPTFLRLGLPSTFFLVCTLFDFGFLSATHIFVAPTFLRVGLRQLPL